MKYDGLFRVKRQASRTVKFIVAISTLALVIAGICFFKLEFKTQITAVGILALTALYTVPFFPNQKNLRNWSGIKIYLVAFCWAGVTTVLPLVNAGVALGTDAWLKFVQRFLLIIVLILIFEIIDLKEDDPHLKTIPQQIGVKRTKILNILLLIPFYCLELFKTAVDVNQLYINIILVAAVAAFTLFASPHRHKYYTLLWVESIPVLWYALVVLMALFI